MNRFFAAIFPALILMPVIAMAQPKPVTVPAPSPAKQRTVEQLDVLGVRSMNEGEKSVACLATLRIVAGSTKDQALADEFNATAAKFREHAIKNGIDQARGTALMDTFSKKFEAVRDLDSVSDSLGFYAMNCMRSALSMGFTRFDVTNPRPAPVKAPAPAKSSQAPAPRK